MVGEMTLGFADLPVEIMRARRKKLESSSKSSFTSNNKTENVHSESNTETEEYLQFPHPHPHVEFRTSHGEGVPLETLRSQAESQHRYIQFENTETETPNESQSGDLPAMKQDVPTPLPYFDMESRSSRSPILGISKGIALGTSKGVGRILLAGFKSPFDMTLQAARGFHNLPKLYGDETVRRPDKITGVWSGLTAAGKVSK